MPHFDRANVNRVDSYHWVSQHQAEIVDKRIAAANQMIARHEAETAAKAEARAAASR